MRRIVFVGAAMTALLAHAAAAPPTRTITFETDQVTEAAVALSPDGSTLVFTMVGHLFRLDRGKPAAEQLTFGPCYDADPAFSPDGSKIVFVSDRDAREGIELGLYVLDLATGRVRRVTNEPFAFRPTFNAAGDAIAYFSIPPQPAFPGAMVLRQVAVSGGEPKTLREGPEQYRSIVRLPDGRIAWAIGGPTPDGKAAKSRIETRDDDGKPVVIAACDGVLERVEASPAKDGFFARRTQGGGMMGSTPQTEDLVFVANGAESGDVRTVVQLDSKSGPRPRIAVSALPSPALVLGDGGRLVRIDAGTGAREIVPMRARVKLEIESAVPPRPAPRPSMTIVNPLLLPDGGLIFEAAGHLWKQPLGAAPAQRIEDRSAGPRAFEGSPAISPDGKALAFVRNDGTVMELCVMDLASDEVKTIASGGGYGQPSWSADGSRIVYVESAGFSATIVSIRRDGEGRTEIGQAGFWSARPNLSANGQWLYTTANVTGVGNVFRQSTGDAGAAPEPVTTLTRHASDGLVSPDGKWLALRRNKEIWIARLPAASDVPATLRDPDVRRLVEEGGDGFSFAPDSSAIVYAAGGRVFRQPVPAGSRVEIPLRLESTRSRPKPVLITNARLLDFGAGGFGAPTSLLLEDGRIAWIGPEGRRPIPPEATTLDAAGKFVIPGLFEMHAHASVANQAAFIAYGVTSVRDTGGSIVGSSEILDRAETSGDPIPRYFFSGEIFEGEHPYWGDGFLQIVTAEDARAYVRRFKAAGASFIKVYPSLPWPLQIAAADEARRVGLPVVGHGMGVNEITRSVTHGFATIEHSLFPLRVHDDVIRMLAASDTRWDPTLAVVGGDSQLLRKEPARLSDAKLLALTPQWAIMAAKYAGYEKDMPDAALDKAWTDQIASLRDAHARGVKLSIGTDAPNPACFYGASLHWEMEFFAAAGIPPIEVLRIATADAAKSVGAADLGTIAPGKLADLVLLDADPLESIKNTQAVWRTVKAGWVFDPATLAAKE